MFYLLEDNRIIETTNEYGVDYIKDPYFNSQNEYEFVYVIDINYQGLQVLRNSTTEKTIGFIKKQSENVFDLIEIGDLVMVDRAKIYPSFYTESIIEISQVFWSESHHSLCVYPRGNGYYCPIIEFGVQKGILTIYKPNSNGDYIKVWEKENE